MENFILNQKFHIRNWKFHLLVLRQKVISLEGVTTNLRIKLEEGRDQLKEVTVYSGRIDKKNNPAIDLLKKIWAQKRKNGLNMYDRYEFDRYEKIEFDLNNIDEKLMDKKSF